MNKIYIKINKIKEKMGTVSKTSGGYHGKALKLNTILNKLDPILKENNIVMTGQSKIASQIIDNGTSILVGSYILTLTDLESGEEFVSQHGFAGNDKNTSFALGKASTYCRKYALMELFNLATDDNDPDFKKDKAAPQVEVDYKNEHKPGWGV